VNSFSSVGIAKRLYSVVAVVAVALSDIAVFAALEMGRSGSPNSPCITCLAGFRSQNSPTDSSDEANFLSSAPRRATACSCTGRPS
jgi:hypothetical protein